MLRTTPAERFYVEALNDAIVALNDTFWLYLIIPVLAVLSLYFTFRSGAVQIRMIPEMVRAMVGKAETAEDGKKAISSFQAFAISAAARIGTGNIAGVATAIALGGPGAVFWMWIMGLVVGAASFVESTLAQLYKVRDKSGFRGGPAYYMLHGLRAKWMGVLFAVVITVTFGFVFNAVQSNTIVGAIMTSVEATGATGMSWLEPVLGLALVAVTAAVIFGGVRRIAHVAQLLVPFMAGLYMILGLVIVVLNIDALPSVFGQIFANAFGFEEMAAGGVGAAIVQGVRRGMFSNEAGLGSAPNAGATASVSHPVKQGLVQTLGVYVDTLLVCSTTAFIVLLSNPTYGENRGPTMTQEALQFNLGNWSLHLLTLIILLVAFTSVLGNYFYGESNVGFLTQNRAVLTGYRWVVLVVTFLGAIGSSDLVWNLADTTMGLMALVNLAAIAPLSAIAFKLLKDYNEQRKQGLDPVFTRDRLPELTGVECWEPKATEPERTSAS
ncbi:alanine or glycine:cation symporter, AGCS family [Saccharopolyspora antimicrobica]|uniref:AGCS family alanine or glycine:cation symporter n=1 Tax=Saccharopolyspora antimicrobica TaxID=455193 RepID=A0A1I5KC13_9PSEU|nr:alanine/glycine:cation symporter family protein [Saccharopolyspora antimicrobica]RKT81942.1 AGCS family alanine or glycine:cation symporter [Saccharopolyspora antimicrobica]SFO82557.1 alanine or glycine:cation symporter, AGCS family [Saccharopolyspora antimicrobica]